MTEGSIWKKLLIFSVPLILGNLLQQLYSTVDSIIVGNCVGKEALAAVGSTGSIVSLLIAFSQGASVGAGVIISQYMGAKRKDDVKRAVHTAMAIAVIIGLVLTVMGVFMSRLFLVWMQTPDNILDGASLYLQIYCGGLLFNVLYNMCAGIFNAAGNSKKTAVISRCGVSCQYSARPYTDTRLRYGRRGCGDSDRCEPACFLRYGYNLYGEGKCGL